MLNIDAQACVTKVHYTQLVATLTKQYFSTFHFSKSLMIFLTLDYQSKRFNEMKNDTCKKFVE